VNYLLNQGQIIMRLSSLLLLMLLVSIPFSVPAKVDSADRNQRITIEHGKVVDIERVEIKSKAGKGAMYGGLLGVASQHGGSGRDIATGAAVGAIVGALIGKATSGHKYAHAIYIRTLDGQNIKIVSEQENLRVGDCVTVESGKHTNVRVESQYVCSPATDDYRSMDDMETYHASEASTCSRAKENLLNAEGSEDLQGLAYKVQVVCEN
jgi:outer membrane lipoprotein SlyB